MSNCVTCSCFPEAFFSVVPSVLSFLLIFSLALGLHSLQLLIFTFFSLINSSSFYTLFFLFLLPLRLSPLFWFGFFSCFLILTMMLVCDWLQWVMWLHVPPTCLLASCLQWAALSGLWVWALPPQALRPLAGCTGAFHGQVPFTTCVTPHLPLQKTPGVVYFFSLVQYSSLQAQTTSGFHLSLLLRVKKILAEKARNYLSFAIKRIRSKKQNILFPVHFWENIVICLMAVKREARYHSYFSLFIVKL